MIICKYKRAISRSGKPFENLGNEEFKANTELEAHGVIAEWNIRGQFKNLSNVQWKYEFVSCKPATLEDRDNPKISFFKVGSC